MSRIKFEQARLLLRQHLPTGTAREVAMSSCTHYDIALYEDMIKPELYLYIQIRAGGFKVLHSSCALVSANGDIVPLDIDFDPMAYMPRYLEDRRVQRLGMTGAVQKALDTIVKRIRSDGEHVNIMLHCISRWDGPEPMQDITNLYVGSARHARDMGMSLPKRERVPGNQGGWLTGRQKSDWTVRERRALRLLNKLIKGVQD